MAIHHSVQGKSKDEVSHFRLNNVGKIPDCSNYQLESRHIWGEKIIRPERFDEKDYVLKENELIELTESFQVKTYFNRSTDSSIECLLGAKDDEKARSSDSHCLLTTQNYSFQNQYINHHGSQVLNVSNYLEHYVLPTDTLQGICLKYKINPMLLKRTNKFSGSSLILAPRRLIIPLQNFNDNRKSRFDCAPPVIISGCIQDTASEDFKLSKFSFECPGLSQREIRSYLNLHEWELCKAISSAKEDDLQKKKCKSLNIYKPYSSTERCFKLPEGFVTITLTLQQLIHSNDNEKICLTELTESAAKTWQAMVESRNDTNTNIEDSEISGRCERRIHNKMPKPLMRLPPMPYVMENIIGGFIESRNIQKKKNPEIEMELTMMTPRKTVSLRSQIRNKSTLAV
mmetsp:Transcript_14161/g.20223  ORF Transcript_14161/g.20223 Transcript_14161/m.20223 type:complete len:400 (+) Transcript_14161:118-1317(+)